MIQVLWEFVVEKGAQGQFELAYGPGGAWSDLFSKAPGFRGTTLLRDADNPQRYISIDLWESRALRAQALADHEKAYADLDSSFAEWTESETELGVFEALSQATVRPRPRK